MATLHPITQKELAHVAGQHPFNRKIIIKDYYVTALLYLFKDIQDIYFKGGTALQKIFLEYSRLSEDVDYTVVRDMETVRKEIRDTLLNSVLFDSLTKDKDVEGFVRLIAHYTDPFGEKDTVFIDLNQRAAVVLKPETHKIKHFYPDNIPEFSVQTLAQKEMIAEKMAATIGRNRPRDHFDLYQILKHSYPIDLALVRKKCEQSEQEFNVIKMFNRAKKLKKRWDVQLLPLLAEPISFITVMQTLAKHFNLKQEKKKLKEEE